MSARRAARRRRRRSRARRKVGEWLQASRRHIQALLAAFALLLCLGLYLAAIGVYAHATGLTSWSFLNTMALCCLAVGVLVAAVAALGLRATTRTRADIAVYEAREARGGPQDVEMTPGQASVVLSSSSSSSLHAYLSGWHLRAYSGQPV